MLDRLAFALLEKETLLENEIAEIFKDVRKRPNASTGTPRKAANVPTFRR